MLNKKILSVAVLACLTPLSSYATNGYSQHGFGTKSKGLAGAGAAIPLEGMSAGTNPALMVDVGDRMEIGIGLFSPKRAYTANDDGSPVGPPMGPPTIEPGRYESDKELFPVPHFAYNTKLSDNSSIGVAMAANGGMNTEYPKAVFAPFNNPMMGTEASSPTGMHFMQLLIGVPYAFKLNADHAFGIIPFAAVQPLKVYRL